jgi:hypothetical protein
VKGADAVASLSLREELLALPGVAEAEVDGDDAAPSGVRVRLAPEADAEAVGAEVQGLLAARGVRSRLGLGDLPVASASPLAPTGTGSWEEAGAPGRRPAAGKVLQSVLVEESAGALQVTVVGSDGRRAVRSASAVGEEELVRAVIAAVGMLLEGAEPRVLSVEWAAVDDSRVVTLVLEGAGGRRGAGAGLVRASRGYAVARAAWSALSD